MISRDDQLQVLGQFWGLKPCQLTAWPSYCDQVALVKDERGEKSVLKISKNGDLLIHQQRFMKFLQGRIGETQIPQLLPTLEGEEIIYFQQHYFRLHSYLPGRTWGEQPNASQERIFQLGKLVAKLRDVAGEFSSCTQFSHHWDLAQLPQLSHLLEAVPDRCLRRRMDYFLLQFEIHVKPIQHQLPRATLHGDLNPDNLLVQGDSLVGIIDFGDMVESSSLFELAIAASYLLMGPRGGVEAKQDPSETSLKTLMDSFRSNAKLPLTPLEAKVLYYCVAGRVVQSLLHSFHQQREQNLTDDNYVLGHQRPAIAALAWLEKIGPEKFEKWVCGAQALNEKDEGDDRSRLLQERERLLPANFSLNYPPVGFRATRGLGTYVFDHRGECYLDCINNIPHIGHSHPRLARQAQKTLAQININTRFLYPELTQLAQKLRDTLPQSMGNYRCFFLCSGSEANSLALRLGATYTQGQAVAVLDRAYHGNTQELISISPYKFRQAPHLAHPQLRVWPSEVGPEVTAQALEQPLTFFFEAILGCGGQAIPTTSLIQDYCQKTQAAGGVVVADEIQVGLGRVADHYWGFEIHRVTPDIVTVGKPLANGLPVAAVLASPAVIKAFEATQMEYFNSFGGTPLAGQAALTVLEVLDEENLISNARQRGTQFKKGFEHFLHRYPQLMQPSATLRGRGLFLGLPLKNENIAQKVIAKALKRGILLASDGPQNNILKFKPPMVITQSQVERVLEVMEKIFRELAV